MPFLARLLKRFYGQDVVVLIDDYDQPLALILAYFDEERKSELMARYIQNLLEGVAVNGAGDIKKVLVTGGYPLDLPSYDCFSLEPEFHSRYFGFTEVECSELCAGFNVDAELIQMITAHYNGEWWP